MKEEEGFKRGLNFSKQFNAAAAREMFGIIIGKAPVSMYSKEKVIHGCHKLW